MVFEKSLPLAVVLALAAALAACGATVDKPSDQNNIGDTLAQVSSVVPGDGPDASSVGVFDETTRRIHVFDVGSMKRLSSHAVPAPSEDHYVLAHPRGDYDIDVTKNHVVITTRDGQANDSALRLLGHPRSAAFRPDLRWLIVYDDMMNVGIVRFDLGGRVESSWVGGPLIHGAAIAAGDLDDQGRLILTMSDQTLEVIDLDQTLKLGQWTTAVTKVTHGISAANWVAPLAGGAQILLASASQLAIVEVATGATVASQPISNIEKLSKLGVPHLVAREGNDLILSYPSGGIFQSRRLYKQPRHMMLSHLSQAGDRWSFADSKSSVTFNFNDLNFVRDDSRSLKSYRLSDMRAMRERSLPAQAQLRLARTYVFALFPSELGYGSRYGVDDDSSTEVKMFNRDFL